MGEFGCATVDVPEDVDVGGGGCEVNTYDISPARKTTVNSEPDDVGVMMMNPPLWSFALYNDTPELLLDANVHVNTTTGGPPLIDVVTVMVRPDKVATYIC